MESRWDVHTRDTVESTNDAAKELVAEGHGHGTVVVAAKQISGKGRHGRRWTSPRGGLYVSIVVEPTEMSVQLLSLFSGIPVIKVLRSQGCVAGLSWPNDVLVGDRKIAGVLCEGIYRHRTFRVIAGMGINNDFPVDALPKEFRARSTTLLRETGRSVPNEELLEGLLSEYAVMLDVLGSESGPETLLARYRKACLTIGKDVVVETDKRIQGKAVGITTDGYLVLETPSREMKEIPEGWLKRVYNP